MLGQRCLEGRRSCGNELVVKKSILADMNRNTWRKKTEARIVSISRLRKTIREQNAIGVGLIGFSGNFKRNTRDDAELITRRALTRKVNDLVSERSPELVYFISGATDLGVPRVGYSVAKGLGCTTVGVTAGAAMRYSLAELDYLTVVGKKFGDESEAFVSCLDELWVFGGGQQSLDECKLAREAQVPITVFQGIGGIADGLCPESFDAKFVNIDQYLLEFGK